MENNNNNSGIDKIKSANNKKSKEIKQVEEVAPPEVTEEEISTTTEVLKKLGKFLMEYSVINEKFGTQKVKSINVTNPNDITDEDLNELSMVNMPSTNDPEVYKSLDYDYDDNDNKAREWVGRVSNSTNLLMNNNVYRSTTEDESREWKQTIKVPGNDKLKLAAVNAGLDLAYEGQLTGDKGMKRIRAMMGLGNMFTLPLWHTGIWLLLNTPSEAALVDLYRELSDTKIRLGRETHGLAFSNLVGVTTEIIVDFVLDHVESTSLKENKSPDELKEIIRVQDIPSLVWGIACTLYPKGFQYSRQCVNTPTCHGVVKELLDLRRIQFIDRSSLTDKMVLHMNNARRMSSIKIEDVNTYQSNLSRIQPKEALLAKDLTNNKGTCDMIVEFYSPSISSYIDSVNTWINSITTMAQKAASEDSDNEKNKYIYAQAKATKARQYSHWIKSIKYILTLDNEDKPYETYINEPNDILKVAEQIISVDSTLIDKLTTETINYINGSTISLIGIPSYDCPHCGTEQDVDNKLPRFINFIPLDVIALFFHLIEQRELMRQRR